MEIKYTQEDLDRVGSYIGKLLQVLEKCGYSWPIGDMGVEQSYFSIATIFLEFEHDIKNNKIK